MWFKGPDFLRQPEGQWPAAEVQNDPPDEVLSLAIDTREEDRATDKLLAYFSEWSDLTRAVAWFQRFFQYLKTRKTTKEAMTVEDINKAEISVLRYVQMKHFPKETEALQKCMDTRGRVINKASTIHQLDPFMDSQSKLLCVGGRIESAPIAYSMKHPIILPKDSNITKMIIRNVHSDLSHAGRNHVLAAVRKKYWVINGNKTVRDVLSKCVPCKKIQGPPIEQKMADLPPERITPAPPFSHSGVDYFGPFLIKRGRGEQKVYGALFTCMASRAVHLEAAPSLETDTFINALRRFTSRRGEVQVIRSDNGTNFRGAHKELQDAIKEIDEKKVQAFFRNKGIDWKFNPPGASWMGGVWERMIRTVRKLLTQMLQQYGNRIDYDVFQTLLTEVENIINSRPLTSLSDDVKDLEPITPNHILGLVAPSVLPLPGKFEQDEIYSRKRWRQVQALAELFWSRWKKEYLVTLQTRQKWHRPRENLRINDIVMIIDANQPRNQWNLGKVVAVQEDKNQDVRAVTVYQDGKELIRPVHKLVKLLSSDAQDD